MKQVDFEILNDTVELTAWDKVVDGSRVASTQHGITILQPDHEAVQKMVNEAVAKALRERNAGIMVYEPNLQQSSYHARGGYYGDEKDIATQSVAFAIRVIFEFLKAIFAIAIAIFNAFLVAEKKGNYDNRHYFPKVQPKQPKQIAKKITNNKIKVVVNGDNNGNITIIS